LTKKKKLVRYVKKKINEMTVEFRFNFFLRLGIEMFLEVIVLSLMNIRYPKFNRLDQKFSFLVALLFLLMFLALLIWSFCYPYKKYDRIRKKGKFDDPRFMSMFGEYKMKNATQIFFNSIFMIRRLLYGFIIIFLIDFPLVQAFLFVMI